MATVTVFSEEEIQLKSTNTTTGGSSIYEDLNLLEYILQEKDDLEQFYINL